MNIWSNKFVQEVDAVDLNLNIQTQDEKRSSPEMVYIVNNLALA